MLERVTPDWQAPESIKAFSTTRQGGNSLPPFDSMNLGLHCGDDAHAVLTNRQMLSKTLKLPAKPLWLSQQHSATCIQADDHHENVMADACYSDKPNQVCVVMTADCVPILMCNNDGTEIAAIHAGWRGLYQGIIANTLKHFKAARNRLHAWIGPCISQSHYAVDEAFYQRFITLDQRFETAFITHATQRHANLSQIATIQLQILDVGAISQSTLDTFDDPRFYSYRAAHPTGRIASLIWR
jgi:polyphenol oxidase